jgi:TetR/AcrR family transcriptional regulator
LTIWLVNWPMCAQRSIGSYDKRTSGQSRDSILRAAERIFAETGLDGARTDAIASAAGVNKALLYYYFKGKDALYEAVLENHMKEFNRLGLGVLGRGGSSRAKVLDFVSMHFEFASGRPYYPRLFHRLMISRGATLEGLARKYTLPVVRELVRVIERGVRAGEIRKVDGDETAISLVGLTAFYFVTAPVVRKVARVDPYDKARLARRKKAILDFVRYGLFRHPEAHWS